MPPFRETYAMQLRQLETLPMLPQLLWELEAAFQNPAAGALEIADLIEKDIGLTATLLKVSNSAFFRGSSEFISVREAVVRIGLHETRRLARAMLLVDALSAGDSGMDYGNFWRHSLLVAVAAAYLQEHAFEGSPLLSDEAYLAGLLHDLGKLILDQYFQLEHQQVIAHLDDHACGRDDAERAVLGADHGHIGAELLELWGLSDNIVEPVRWHHALDDAPEEWRTAARLLRTADKIIHERDAGEFQHESVPELSAHRVRELQAELDREETLLRIITSV